MKGINSLTNNSLTQLLRQAAVFNEKRHEVLVGNVANVDTPTYKTRDLDTNAFQKAILERIQARRSPLRPEYSQSQPAVQASGVERIDVLDEPALTQPVHFTFQDGNNRSIEQEMAELTKNLMRQSFLIRVMSAQMSQLELVISERI